MNNETRNKLLTHEVPPPAGIWDKIASELDASDSGMVFPRRLHDMEVPAPAHTWQHIAAALDGFASGLSFPRRLQELEVTPPSNAWQQIAAALEENGAPAKTFRIPWLKYAAAAAIISFLTWGALSYFKNSTSKDQDIASNPVLKSGPVVNTNTSSDNTGTASTQTDQQRDDQALEESKHTYASIDMGAISRRVQRSFIQLDEPVSLAAPAGNLNPAQTYQEMACNEVNQPAIKVSNDTNLSTRYVLLMTPDGKLIRISRKWGSLLCCVSGEDSDPGCTDQVKEWRAKVAGAMAAPSSGNFMDVLSLVNSLQEN